MDQKVAPYINFQGRAREAMEFYHDVFGGELELFAADEQGRPRAAAEGERIMYARLKAGGISIVASDGHPSFPASVGDHIALVLSSSDRPAMERAVEKLADGGQLKMPLRDAAWGGAAAWLSDRFGINWNIEVDAG